MNTKLRTKAKNNFEKSFFKLMNNAVFGKLMENVRKHRDIKLVTANLIIIEGPNYHATKYFSENMMAIEMKKTKVKMNKPIYLGMSKLDICETLLYELWYDYIKHIANDIKEQFDISNYDNIDRFQQVRTRK